MKTRIVLGALAFAWIGAAAPAGALTFGNREVVCPIDGKTFTARAVMSQTQFGVRLDLRPHGALAAPLPIPVCPGSGLPVFRDKFSEAELATLKALVETAEYKAVRAAHTDYYVWAWIEERLGNADPGRIGFILLRASWEAENGQPARVAEYRALARDRYDAYVAAGKGDANAILTARLLAAELDRLLGRFAEAQARLDALKPETLPENPPLRAVAQQIAKWVAQRNAAPQNFVR